jgi:lipopolysaccharide transport system ATP-binding protein
MSDIAIKVENLSKSYILGHRSADNERYVALRDVIMREARNFSRKAIDLARGRQIVQGDEVEEFWALQDISFEIERGEVLGIIGRNGAGKSTLLKILSRITSPTKGRVELRGRVASLLEVGTGFHPELSGRENIFLNGAILGMTRTEIRKKFDEIVAFSEIEKFLDTPVKRYSSGMYVRLAFSIAAHLEPEILIVDEVLAVGDSEFQKKCLGRLDQAAHQDGRTVLFVSHDLNAISRIARSGILLAGGKIVAQGKIGDVVAKYLSTASGAPIYLARAKNGRKPFVKRIEVKTVGQTGVHESGAPLSIALDIEHPEAVEKLCLVLQIVNQFHQSVIIADAFYPDMVFATEPGQTTLVCRFQKLRLNVGRYYLKVYLIDLPPSTTRYEFLEGVCTFEVVKIDKVVSYSWTADLCTYFEDFEWFKQSNGV